MKNAVISHRCAGFDWAQEKTSKIEDFAVQIDFRTETVRIQNAASAPIRFCPWCGRSAPALMKEAKKKLSEKTAIF